MAIYWAQTAVLTALRQYSIGGPRRGALKKVILRLFAYELIYSPKKGSRDRSRSRIVSIERKLYF